MVDRYTNVLSELGMAPSDEDVRSDVSANEAAIGVSLPTEYKQFLKTGAGWWGDVCCPSEEPTPFGDHVLCGFHDADETSAILDSMITPRNMITIASGHFGAFTCLSVCGIDRGAVYALDSEFRSRWPDEMFYERFNAIADSIKDYLRLRRDGNLPQKHDSYDSLYLLAPDWETFLSRCKPCGDEE